MYDARVLADSISPIGVRLITIVATFPRFILAELNTHRVFSRNSASSRAIPTEKLIERVLNDPFVPETFNKRVKGMGIGEKLEDKDAIDSRRAWLWARDDAVDAAETLNNIGVDKSRANRLLEPFMWHTAIVTSTEWDNFFALRCPAVSEATKDFPAQIEFQKIAIMMRQAMFESEPQPLDYGEWHLPLVTAKEKRTLLVSHEMYWPRVSAGRCARVSFDTHENYEPVEKSWGRQVNVLEKNGHLSPSEHPATPRESNQHRYLENNFNGWTQLRNFIPYQQNLVGHLEGRGSWEDEAAIAAALAG